MTIRITAVLISAILTGSIFTQDAPPSSLDSLLEAIRAHDLKAFNAALAQKPDLNSSQNSFDETALGLAAKVGFVKAVDLLIQAGANVNTADKSGKTPLFQCVLNWDIFMGKGGRDKNDPMTEENRIKNVRAAAKLLIKAGAKINYVDPDTGATVLHKAANAGHLDLIKLLLAAKADTTVLDKNGRTAYDYLKAMGENFERFKTAEAKTLLKALKTK